MNSTSHPVKASGGGRRIPHAIAVEPTEFISTGATDGEAVDFLNELFRYAARHRVSDIHFEDTETECRIRMRVNGQMVDMHTKTKQMSEEFDRLIRVKCRMSLVERSEPQDGKFRFDVDERLVDVRCSLLPIELGQSIVCRLLDESAALVPLDQLRMPEDIRAAIHRVIAQPQGLLLVTGPTGSGKTTTLYGCLLQLNTPKVKILTAEDPVEFRLKGIVQAQVTKRLTFATALRTMLRQDPDIIMVGEIRDAETAGIATQAALTGHIVISTLHTNNAAMTLTRLLDLKVDANALAHAVGGFMAQRLVRTLCAHCRIGSEITTYARRQLQSAGMSATDVAAIQTVYERHEPGCEKCIEGWSGRTPIFELITATDETRLAIEEKDLKALERAAKLQPQYRTLAHGAMLLVADGITSMAEALAVTGASKVQIEEN